MLLDTYNAAERGRAGRHKFSCARTTRDPRAPGVVQRRSGQRRLVPHRGSSSTRV